MREAGGGKIHDGRTKTPGGRKEGRCRPAQHTTDGILAHGAQAVSGKEEGIALNRAATEEIARMAAKEAVKELKKEIEKENKTRNFRNTRKLMQNYNRICQSVQEGIADLSDMDGGEGLQEFSEEDIFINSIMKSKLRSIIMIAHIDKCMQLLENEEYQSNTIEKYLAFKYYYLDDMTYESIAEIYGYAERTARRWVNELTSILSIYLFGADAVILE